MSKIHYSRHINIHLFHSNVTDWKGRKGPRMEGVNTEYWKFTGNLQIFNFSCFQKDIPAFNSKRFIVSFHQSNINEVDNKCVIDLSNEKWSKATRDTISVESQWMSVAFMCAYRELFLWLGFIKFTICLKKSRRRRWEMRRIYWEKKNGISDFHLINTTSRLRAINRVDLSVIESAYSGEFWNFQNVIGNVRHYLRTKMIIF